MWGVLPGAWCFDSWRHHWLKKTKTLQRCHCAMCNRQRLSPRADKSPESVPIIPSTLLCNISSWATNYITPTGGNQRQTMQLHTLRVVFCNTENHVMQPGKALQLVAVQKKYKVWSTVHFLTSLQPQQKVLLDMVDVGFHKIQRP